MDELLYGKADVWWGRLFFFSACLISAAVMVFCVAGIYNTFWGVPAKVERIAILEKQAKTWESRTKELEKYINEQDKKYQVATRWSKFHDIMCDVDQKIRFDMLENYLVKKGELYKANGAISKLNR